MRFRAVVAAVLCLLAAVPLSAHQPMTHDCRAPVRPVDDQNDQLWSAFLQEIQDFQFCVTAEADRHQAASEAHQRAAQEAVSAWNQFVRTSLNAPEDFPWPPDEK